jgi:hypothetical protein
VACFNDDDILPFALTVAGFKLKVRNHCPVVKLLIYHTNSVVSVHGSKTVGLGMNALSNALK